jgi:putative ABC transport system permease protein
MNVPNKQKINSIAFRMIKTKKSRNFFSIFAVMLTSILIMPVLTMGSGLVEASRVTQMKSSGQNSEIAFQYLTENDVEKVISNSLIDEYGISKYVTSITDGAWSENTLEIRTADKNFAEMTYSKPSVGKLPENENEVAVKSWMLEKLSIPIKIGETFPLSFSVDGKQYNLELTVCGIWNDNALLLPYGTAFISDTLADKLLKQDYDYSNSSYIGSIQLFANLKGRISDLEKNLEKLVSETGINKASLPGVNPAFKENKYDAQTLSAIALILLIVIISGYLLIYNIFCISVIKDIKFYGLLKTIGTTKPQIKRIVNIQALVYCLIGIPLGLILGYFLAVGLFPLFISITSADKIDIKPDILSMLLSAFLSLVTVFISCFQPAKTAAKISPIESVKYTGISVKNIKTRKKYKGAGVKHMAYANLFKNKKKTLITVASVSIGLVIMNFSFTFSGSMNIEGMVNSYICGDFLVADKLYLNTANSYAQTYRLTEETVKELSNINGVENVAEVYYKYDEKTYVNGGEYTHSQLYGVDDYWIEMLQENIVDGNFDREKFLSGKYILIGSDMSNLVKTGDVVTLSNDKKYEVMGKVNYEKLYVLSARFFLGMGFSAYLPKSEVADFSDSDIMSATVIAEKKKLDKVKNEISKTIESNYNLGFRSRSDYTEQMKNNNSQFTLVGISLSLIILLIGVLNFINTSLTSIISRKYEFAVLQAIGMTSKQIRNMLKKEGFYFIIISGIISLVLGSLLSFGIIQMLSAANSSVFIYHFTILPHLLNLLILFIIAITIPQYFYKSISKNSIIERLNEIN